MNGRSNQLSGTTSVAGDDRQKPGQFVLTGSSVPNDDVSRHTGAGRFSFLRMRPMTLYETGHSNAAISLSALMEGRPQRSVDPGLTVADLADRISVGGWPAQQNRSIDAGLTANRDYLDQVCNVDLGRVAGGHRDPAKVARLLKSLARNVSTEVSISVLAADTGGADGPLSRTTVAEYLSVLERLMVVENQPSWAPHLRSRAILRSSSKRHFVDPLACGRRARCNVIATAATWDCSVCCSSRW